MRIALVLLALLLLAGVALVVIAVLEDEEVAEETYVDTEDDEPEENGTPAPTPTVDEPTSDPNRVPRVLPPDAALEDIRDALAANDRSATQEAYERFGRLATNTGRVRVALRKELAGTTDPELRAIGITALGRARDKENERWLLSILNDMRTAQTDRSSALMALATAKEGSENTVSRSHLDRIDVLIGPLPDTVSADVRRYLDASTGFAATALATLHASVRHSDVYARMIITNDGKRRARFEQLDDATWKELRDEAIACPTLDDRSKEKLAKVP